MAAATVFLGVAYAVPLAASFAAVAGAADRRSVARCALEKDDGGEVGVDKLYQIIRDCRLGIHFVMKGGVVYEDAHGSP